MLSRVYLLGKPLTIARAAAEKLTSSYRYGNKLHGQKGDQIYGEHTRRPGAGAHRTPATIDPTTFPPTSHKISSSRKFSMDDPSSSSSSSHYARATARRRISPPTRPNPTIMVAHVPGSGTALNVYPLASPS
jgi:hypothetical protein